MIDSAYETILSLAEAASYLPRRRMGRKAHVSTLYRWATVGCKGIILESIQVGGTRCTSREAMQRFFERLTPAACDGPVGHVPLATTGSSRHRTLAQRQRAADEADRKLAEMGA